MTCPGFPKIRKFEDSNPESKFKQGFEFRIRIESNLICSNTHFRLTDLQLFSADTPANTLQGQSYEHIHTVKTVTLNYSALCSQRNHVGGTI